MNFYKSTKLLITTAKTKEKLQSISDKIATIYLLDDTKYTQEEYTELVTLINEKMAKFEEESKEESKE